MKTQRISIMSAAPGMTVADDVYTIDNRLVIAKGTTISDKILIRLKYYSVENLLIVIPDAPTIASPVTKISHSEKMKNSIEFKRFNQEFAVTAQDFKKQLGFVLNNNTPINQTQLLEHVSKIMSESRNGIHLFDMLHCMRGYDDISYVHSINVSLICSVFGKWLKFSQDEIDVLCLCGLLHDIGKLMLPKEIMFKQEPLSDEEYAIVRTHPDKGYMALKNKDLDQRIKNVALMHHERCDGSGYPNGLHSSQIDSFAKIIAIADVYDAMTSARVYRPALSPFEAISTFEMEGLQKYDPHYIMTFLEGIVQSYLGNRVRLNNKLVGEIVMINRQALSKPMVKIENTFLDLSKEHNIFIEAIL